MNNFQKLVKYLIKTGSNPEEAMKRVERTFDYVERCYEGATIRTKAHVIMSI